MLEISLLTETSTQSAFRSSANQKLPTRPSEREAKHNRRNSGFSQVFSSQHLVSSQVQRQLKPRVTKRPSLQPFTAPAFRCGYFWKEIVCFLYAFAANCAF